ncbi:MAG: hypothetical protein KDI36_19475 [Pseudomonadales bacterium]|nr:hypothetical protein [Pseudomonadales bacterium]
MKLKHIVSSMALITAAFGAGTTALAVPDLSGTYDTATLTPLQRPAIYGNKLWLTPEEAKAIEEKDAQGKLARSQASDPDREAPPEGGDGSTGAAGNVGGYNTFWIDNGDSINTVNGKFRTSILDQPENGRLPEMTPEAGKRLAKLYRAFRRGNEGKAWWVHEGDGSGPYDDMEIRAVAERCLLGFGSTAGPPMLPVLYNNLKRIVQTDDYIMIHVEMVHDARIIRMNSEHLPADIKRWLGDSIGWWEGDTLVVDTTNFHPSATFRGASENLHVVEKFTLQEDGSLLYSFTVEDDNTWLEPFHGQYSWPRTEDKIFEYACHESNHALGGILRGARLLEQEALAEKAEQQD